MLVEHRGARPRIDPSAYIAPNAVVCGDVTVGPDARILFGAVVVAEGAPVTIGSCCVVMEQAVVRGRSGHPVTVGDHSLIGPHAHVNGATIGSEAFLATGSSVFVGASIGDRAEVRINGVVHVNTVLPPGGLVPIGWVAVGDPAQVHPPEAHDAIWAVQQTLDFPGTAFGLPRPADGESLMPAAMRRYAESFGRHRDDRLIS